MSSPGGHWGSNQYGQQYDPLTGQPLGGSHGAPGQPMRYQGFGAFSQPAQQPPYPGAGGGFPEVQPPRRRGPLIAAISLVAVTVIAIVTTIIVLTTGEDQPQAQTTPPTTTTARPSTSPRTTTSAAPTAANPDLTPVVPGWQVVRVPRRGAVYDVPMDWTLDTPDNIHGIGPPDDPVTMTGVAVYQEGFCPGDPRSYRAITGATARKGPDDQTVADQTLQKFIQHAYTRDGRPPMVVPNPPEHVQLNGGLPAVLASAQITLAAPGPCDPTSAYVSVLATNSDGQGSVVFLAAADQNIPDAIPIDAMKRISGSFRPAPN
ncbi:hypothetical protein GCM10011581_10610 [Saccharopolyspora subtropica]|uniref:DUF8017 domain-containing protein n=1 Tax=Saccharopolyspora thermophila TaxID=89367 RepID=A0A917N884_9PSEU|nr:hypothetical protein [Saccharopolyspora subtropica]GGI75425.1 hypothetical protein GCM10011581_10610 [Saccharopolyspora subtropica]